MAALTVERKVEARVEKKVASLALVKVERLAALTASQSAVQMEYLKVAK